MQVLFIFCIKDNLSSNLIWFIELTEKNLKAIKTQAERKTTFSENILCQHSNGDYSNFFVTLKTMDLPYGNGQGYYCEIVTEVFNLESKTTSTMDNLIHMGRITSQISHDISNPLAILQIHCDSFKLIAEKQEMVPSTEITKRVEKMGKATTRITDTTKELKHFAKALLTGNESEVQKLWEKPSITETGDSSFHQD